MKWSSQKEAPAEKPARDVFDPKIFLAKVRAGQTVLEFHKNPNRAKQQWKERCLGRVFDPLGPPGITTFALHSTTRNLFTVK
jgi:hypothetical protein